MRTMSSRLIAFLLVFVLAFAGLSTQEVPSQFGSSDLEAPATSVAVIATTGVDPASFGELQRDDQLPLSHAETLVDLPGLVPVGPSAANHAPRTPRPGRYATAAMPPPYLDGLQRPPSTGDRLA